MYSYLAFNIGKASLPLKQFLPIFSQMRDMWHFLKFYTVKKKKKNYVKYHMSLISLKIGGILSHQSFI